ncbi:MAG TPA: UDP-glucose 4-epimerase GalE [Terriglobales bacterium]|nr:UDP-glucose 4-epimerase GalE [Terriglobales bacterium]
MAERILVTGGAGYIGSVVAAELVKKSFTVTVYDNLSHGSRAAVPKGAELVVGDVCDRSSLSRLFTDKKFDAVMHFAALIEAGESMKVPESYFRNNSANALTLLEAVLEHKVPRFVFSSTAALYGNPERVPIEETDALRPTNAYGESKLLVERMLAWFHRVHGLRYASLRYFNAAGAARQLGEDHRPESHLVPLVLQVALGKRESVSIYGADYATPDGTCLRDYIHVLDLASAHLLALEALKSRGRLIYNLGNGRGFSVLQVVETARRITGHAIPVEEVERRPGDPAVLVASSERIKRELGWTPQHPELEQIVRSAWEWRRRHPNGYEDHEAR